MVKEDLNLRNSLSHKMWAWDYSITLITDEFETEYIVPLPAKQNACDYSMQLFTHAIIILAQTCLLNITMTS